MEYCENISVVTVVGLGCFIAASEGARGLDFIGYYELPVSIRGNNKMSIH